MCLCSRFFTAKRPNMVRYQITGKASKDHLLLLMLMAEVAHRCRGTNSHDH
ncbi:unnamed protein product, partial [Ixodes persulcatus]